MTALVLSLLADNFCFSRMKTATLDLDLSWKLGCVVDRQVAPPHMSVFYPTVKLGITTTYDSYES